MRVCVLLPWIDVSQGFGAPTLAKEHPCHSPPTFIGLQANRDLLSFRWISQSSWTAESALHGLTEVS
jgi:hypothetical protein